MARCKQRLLGTKRNCKKNSQKGRKYCHLHPTRKKPKAIVRVKTPGLLEVPKKKRVHQMPLKHFKKLVKKKGYGKIARGLLNLRLWNKRKNKKLSRWANATHKKLKAWWATEMTKFKVRKGGKKRKIAARRKRRRRIRA